VVEAVGGIDEALFLYAEDIEWCCRIRDHGLRPAGPGGRPVRGRGRPSRPGGWAACSFSIRG
jgi:hypothetical protein